MADMAAQLAAQLAGWVAGLTLDDLPAEVIADARLRLLDTLGIMLGAVNTPTAVAVRRAARALGRGRAARIVGTRAFNTASLAALANGTIAHAMDFDDTHNASVMHPSAVSVPAALAVTQARGGTGAELVLAIAIGNEIGCRLGLVAPGAFHDVGLHPTSVLGTPAAALLAGRLMGLDATRLAWALGIAGSQGSGILEAYSDGTWSKTLHPGWAAHAGIVAATLAQSGFTGPASGLDGRYGLFPSHIQTPGLLHYEAATEGLGARWHMTETAFKLYPCAHSIHAFAEGALALRAAHGLVAEQIERVELEIPAGFVGQIAEPRAAKLAPRTTTHARASVLYAVATALTQGELGTADYTDAAIARPDILALCQRVTHHVQPQGSGPIAFSGAISITLRDGTTLSHVVAEADGTGARRLAPQRLEDKFRATAGATLPAGKIETVISLCRGIETLPTIDALLNATV